MISTPNRTDMVFPKVRRLEIDFIRPFKSIFGGIVREPLMNRYADVSCQGGWEDDEDVYEAASREAMEEAGVKGIIDVNTGSTHLVISPSL